MVFASMLLFPTTSMFASLSTAEIDGISVTDSAKEAISTVKNARKNKNFKKKIDKLNVIIN